MTESVEQRLKEIRDKSTGAYTEELCLMVEALQQQVTQLRAALTTIMGICAPGKDGRHHRLDKVFGRIMDVYNEAMHPDAARALTGKE